MAPFKGRGRRVGQHCPPEVGHYVAPVFADTVYSWERKPRKQSGIVGKHWQRFTTTVDTAPRYRDWVSMGTTPEAIQQSDEFWQAYEARRANRANNVVKVARVHHADSSTTTADYPHAERTTANPCEAIKAARRAAMYRSAGR